MPELPEVETLCRQLRQVIVGQRILEIEVIDPKLGLYSEAIGRRVTAVNRWGKNLDILFDRGGMLRLHLRMSGRLLWQTDYHLPLSHTRFIVCFDDGRLLCIDPRRFATLSLQPVPSSPGPPDYPLLKEDLPRLRVLAGRRRISVKALLMDQTVLAGLGNIYASEILHEAAVSPECRACDLDSLQWESLADAAGAILKNAVRDRGTTISDWRDLFGKQGENQRRLKVYGREGETCFRCGASIVRRSIGGRGTYYCPACQK